MFLPKILGGLLHTPLYPLSEADEVHGQSWQLTTAIHDEGDGLTLCELVSQSVRPGTHCHVTFKLFVVQIPM